ncbi:WD repeat-containing protein on Y chromosome-like [Trematomus bernacchii]|uniref:WD repeat-containing protein on Y chromosome-like n=1 Tax=Trematomus bernacchii TaxID=40690 RepID=UPI00146B7765|nr:WD repeat-containing protein on Y chromosome-like [Trematomus bernacchii]
MASYAHSAEEDLDENATIAEGNACSRMFSAQQIPEIVALFEEADEDGGGGLDMEEFCVLFKKMHPSVKKEELTVLHMQIDTNCDGTVDLVELLDFLIAKGNASAGLDFKRPFPKPVEFIPVGHYKEIVGVIFRPFEDVKPHFSFRNLDETRTYQRGQYISVSSDGVLTFWTDSCTDPFTIPLYVKENALPFSHHKKMSVNDIQYIQELKQLAISTSDRELLFYDCSEIPSLFSVNHSLILEESIVNTINYWSNGTKAMFSFGDVKGFLTVFISYNVKKNGLFNRDAFEKISLQDYPTVYISNLLNNHSQDFLCLKVSIFSDICSQIQYFPVLNSFAICGSLSKTMVLAALPNPPRTTFSKSIFKSSGDEEFFTCVEYSPSAELLLTGGTDGLLRLWLPHKINTCQKSLVGHVRPITNIVVNRMDRTVITLSDDKNVRVWSLKRLECRQSIEIQGMRPARISSMFYNILNNDLVLANTDLVKYFGRGTDVFKETLTSHDKPLCNALYHSIYKKVVSVCQKGEATVWDVLTGMAVMQFQVTPYGGHTAIAFDIPQQRLITVSKDGKLKLWNLITGVLLEEFPVTLPSEVTGIVCMDDSVLVSGRNSNRIFVVDLEGYDNIFLEHDYLDDICSMDVHDTTLLAASCNGNIVMWDVESREVLYWLNGSQSPRTYITTIAGRTGCLPDGKTHKEETGRKNTDVNTGPIVLCLKTREVNVHTATLLTSADGFISAWSVKSKGGLLGKFRAVNDEDAIITSMSTDVNEQILLTGDSTGRICQWDIQRFGFKDKANTGPFEDIRGWRVSLCPPPRLGTWQSHLSGVVSVQFDSDCQKIITAGLDCNIQLWKNTGDHIGLFGKDEWDADAKKTTQKERRPVSAGKGKQLPFKYFRPERESKKEQEDDLDDINDELPFLPRDDLTDKEMDRIYRRLIKIQPNIDTIREKFKQQQSIRSAKQCASVVQQEAEQASKVQLMNSKSSFKPHPPQTPLMRGETADPYLKQPGSKNGRVINHQKKDTLQGRVLTPCPPDIVQSQQRSELTTKHSLLPPIPKGVQRTHNQTQFRPHPPQSPLIRGETADPDLKQPGSKYGRVINHQKKDTLQGRVLTPCPPDIVQSQQRSELTTKHSLLPPIPKGVQRTHNQTQFRPHPPQSPLIRGETADPDLKQPGSKYGRVIKHQNKDPLQGRVLTPCLPVIVPNNQRSEPTTKRPLLPTIPKGVQRTHNQTQFRPHPPPTPIITGGSSLKTSSPQTPRLRLPPLTEKVQLTTRGRLQ